MSDVSWTQSRDQDKNPCFIVAKVMEENHTSQFGLGHDTDPSFPRKESSQGERKVPEIGFTQGPSCSENESAPTRHGAVFSAFL